MKILNFLNFIILTQIILGKDSLFVEKQSINEIKQQTYLYNLPPYPLPSSTKVKVKVYWQGQIDFTLDNISLLNINGTDITKPETIDLEKADFWNGTITLDCTKYNPGLYFILISHGSNQKAIKIIIN